MSTSFLYLANGHEVPTAISQERLLHFGDQKLLLGHCCHSQAAVGQHKRLQAARPTARVQTVQLFDVPVLQFYFSTCACEKRRLSLYANLRKWPKTYIRVYSIHRHMFARPRMLCDKCALQKYAKFFIRL